uniref:Uncharacterized protein n=1 Tax=Oryza barthii TaxID=65489 RepID=A0A0D3EQD7_9ORYZ
MDATLACSPECLLDTYFPDGKPQSLHAGIHGIRRTDQEEAINHEAEDAHHDFFPLQAHPVLDSPCNPHPLGGHYCCARTTCPAGLVGLNASTTVDDKPAYHVARFDNNDLLLGTHAAIDFYEVDASAAVVSAAAAAADAARWPLDDEMVEDDYLDDPPAIDAAAYVTWIRQRSHNIKCKQHLDLVVLGGLVLASYHLLDDALIDLVNTMHQFIDISSGKLNQLANLNYLERRIGED